MWKEKLGNYLIDISKYVLTGIVIASLFKDVEDKKIFNLYTWIISRNGNINSGSDSVK